MTKQILLEAIAAFDPDGNGLSRVLQAADVDELQCAYPTRCLLSVAWSNKDIRTSVDNFTYWRRKSSGEPIGGYVYHGYNDVISWFDSLRDGDPNGEVMAILGGGE